MRGARRRPTLRATHRPRATSRYDRGSCRTTRRPSSPVFSTIVKRSRSAMTRSGPDSWPGATRKRFGMAAPARTRAEPAARSPCSVPPHSNRNGTSDAVRPSSSALSSIPSFAWRKVDAIAARRSGLRPITSVSPARSPLTAITSLPESESKTRSTRPQPSPGEPRSRSKPSERYLTVAATLSQVAWSVGAVEPALVAEPYDRARRRNCLRTGTIMAQESGFHRAGVGVVAERSHRGGPARVVERPQLL
jgi:hypothetical protein